MQGALRTRPAHRRCRNASRRLRQHPLKQLHRSDKLKVVAAHGQPILLHVQGVVLVKRFVHAARSSQDNVGRVHARALANERKAAYWWGGVPSVHPPPREALGRRGLNSGARVRERPQLSLARTRR